METWEGGWDVCIWFGCLDQYRDYILLNADVRNEGLLNGF